MKTHAKLLAALACAAMAIIPAVAQEATATLDVTEDEEHGPYLVDGEGMALYMFEADTQGTADQEAVSNCYDACAEAWPPLIADSPPEVGDRAQSALIGSVERRDGEMQVTYGGWPLYYFVRDEEPGQTTGHDVDAQGGEWYLVTPDGEPVGH